MELKTLDEKLGYIASKVQIDDLTIPSNFNEAKEQLKQNPDSNPSLNYDGNKYLQEFKKIMSSSEPLDKKLTEISKELQDYKNHQWYPLFSQTLDELNYKIRLVSNMGNSKILKETSVKLFGEDNHAFTPEKFAKAQGDMQGRDKTNEIKEYDEQDFTEYIKPFCDKIGYTIEISDIMASRINHNPAKKEIVVKKGSKFSKKDMEKLLLHEVETHAYQAFNARQQPYIYLALNGPKEADTREALAGRSEKEYDVLATRIRAAHYFACGLAHHLPLSNVFSNVKCFVDEDKAAGISLRAKQGLINTAEPGSNLKNTSYYKRLDEILELPLEDIRLLFSGRFSVSHLDILKTLKDLKEPQVLPEYLR